MNRISIKVIGIEVRGEKAINFINERLVKDLAETDNVVKVLEVINEEGFAMFEVETNFHNPVTVADYFISFINRRKRFIITRNEEVVVEEVAVAEEEGEVKAEISADELNRKYGKISGEEALTSYIEGKKKFGDAFEECVIHSMLLLVINTAKKLFPKFIGTNWELLDHVEKCKRAVRITVEDFEMNLGVDHVAKLFEKGCEIYGKAYEDAVPEVVKDYIKGEVDIQKGFMIEKYYSDESVEAKVEEYKALLTEEEEWNKVVTNMIEGVEEFRHKWISLGAKLGKADALALYNKFVKEAPNDILRMIKVNLCFYKKSGFVDFGFQPKEFDVVMQNN